MIASGINEIDYSIMEQKYEMKESPGFKPRFLIVLGPIQ